MKLGFLKSIEEVVVKNAPAILTGVGVVGTLATAVLTARSTFKAAQVIDDARFAKRIKEKAEDAELTNQDKMQLTWKFFLLPAGVAVTTCAATIMAQHINAKRAAALIAGYAVIEGRYNDYVERAKEFMGVEEAEDLQERVEGLNPEVEPKQMIIIEGSDVLMHEAWTGRTYRGNLESLKMAENDVNYKLQKEEGVSLNDIYDRLGIPHTSDSESFGWLGGEGPNHVKRIKFNVKPIETDEGKPALSFDYDPSPDYDFWRYN